VEGAPLINEIYEAAILPEKWEQVLDQLAEMADAEGTLLFAAGPGVPRWLSSQSIRAVPAASPVRERACKLGYGN
jgi:hypothetical protein